MPDAKDLPPILRSFGTDLANAMRDIEQRVPAPESGAAGASPGRRWRRRGTRRFWLAVPALAVLLGTTTIALAAAGVILTGSPVRPRTGLSAGAGEGVPEPGQSRLLPLRVPDPAGGLPWGIRIVHTTRGLICLQVGRVQGGELGELGVDGAFHDDGRFHPESADVLPDVNGSAVGENASCQLADQTFTGELWGFDRNAAANQGRAHAPLQDLRDISYGHLGVHGVSVTYRSDNVQHTESVLPGTGAYLIVGPASAGQRSGSGGSKGTDPPRGGLPGLVGALTQITYRFQGKLCQDRGKEKVADPCPRPSVAPRELAAGAPPALHLPVHAMLKLRGARVVAAEISFTAPFAITSAGETYLVTSLGGCPRADREAAIQHNVTRGATIQVTLHDPFRAGCGRVVRATVEYDLEEGVDEAAPNKPPSSQSIGSVILRLPRAAVPASPTRRRIPR